MAFVFHTVEYKNKFNFINFFYSIHIMPFVITKLTE